jgi:hypothetical protein
LACNLLYQVLLLFMWNSQAKDHHYSVKEWPKHEQFNLDKELPHLPYSPQLTPSGIHLFRPLKGTLHGCHFGSDEVGKEVTFNWPVQQPKDFICRGLYGKLEWVWRTWWALHWWLMLMHCNFFFWQYITLYNFSSFHLSDPCILQRKMKWECSTG